MQGLVDVVGVRVAEVDYTTRVVDLVLEPGLSGTPRAELRRQLARSTGVAGVST